MSTNNSPKGLSVLSKDQRKAIRGWCMYDWANSAFATSASVAILPVYFVFLFKEAFGEEVQFLSFTLTGSSMWSFAVAISTAVVAITSPVLGVIADRAPIKKTLLWVYTCVGALFTILTFFSVYTGAPWAWLLGSFILANIGFAGGLVFYNAFLPHLAPKELLDDISSRGFAYGYIGGGLLLAVHLGLIVAFQDTDYADLTTRIALGSVGVWWFGWSIWTFRTLPEPDITNPEKDRNVLASLSKAVSELGRTVSQIPRFRIVLIYLVAYLLFNDGIQTVLTVAGAFAADTLGVSLVFNMLTILVIQFIAAPGAKLFGWLANVFNTKRALSVALVGWGIVILFGIGIAPLVPQSHSEYEYQIEYDATNGNYKMTEEPDLSDVGFDATWATSDGIVSIGDALSLSAIEKFTRLVDTSEVSRFSLSVKGGPLDGTHSVGPEHVSDLTGGPVDWWPNLLRELIWDPIGLSVNLQWLILGSFVGVVMGGSQALARSLFAYITPETRSGEFFGFFGFVSRASAVVGPMLYVVFTAVYDTRMAVLAILVIIIAGTVVLSFVNPEKARSIAESEDARIRGSSTES